jgi:integrase/recombinase XerD
MVDRTLDRTKYLIPAERDRLLTMLDDEAILAKAKGHKLPVRDAMAIRLAFASGLRASELCALQIRDIDLTRGRPVLATVRHGKGDKARDVVLPPSMRKILADYIGWLDSLGPSVGDHTFLFFGRGAKALTRSSLWRRWTAALKRAGLPPRPLHATRHTMALIMYRQTKDIRMVQKTLGHSRLDTTQIYADVMESDIERAQAAIWDEKPAD